MQNVSQNIHKENQENEKKRYIKATHWEIMCENKGGRVTNSLLYSVF